MNDRNAGERVPGGRGQHKQGFLDAIKRLGQVDLSNPDAALQQITELDSRALGVERVSIWLFSEDRTRLECKDMFVLSRGVHEPEEPVTVKDYPAYFSSVERELVIDADDALNDPRTYELRDTYLKPRGITSMMDVPIRIFGAPAGVICHEHTGPQRVWKPEEKQFVHSVASLASVALQSWKMQEVIQQDLKRMRAVERIALAINRRLEPELLCNETLDRLLEAADADRAALLLLDADGVLRFKAHRNLSDGYRRSVEGHAPWKPDDAFPQPILVPDVEQEQGLGSLRDVILGEGIRAMAFFPLMGMRKWVGKLMTYYNRPRKFTEAEVAWLVNVCAHLGSALERERLETQTRHQQAYLLSLVDHSPMAIVQLDTHDKIVSVNPAFQTMFGYGPSEAVGKLLNELIVPPERWAEASAISETVFSGCPVSRESIRQRKDGTSIWVTIYGCPVVVGKHIVGGYAMYADITDRKKAERELAEERERLAVTLRSVGDGVIAADTDLRVVLMNTVAERLTGWDEAEAIQKPLAEVFKASDQKGNPCITRIALQVLNDGAVRNFGDCEVRDYGGTSPRLVEGSCAPIHSSDSKIIGVVIVFRDITERRHLEMEVSKVERLRSLAILAGGIAHDFNNYLTGILANISLMRALTPESDARREMLDDAEEACNRAKELTRQLLTFAKGGAPVKTAARLPEVLRQATSLALRGSSVALEWQVPEDIPLVEMDTSQMSQVFNNIALNARQAMPVKGVLTVSARFFVVESERDIPRPARAANLSRGRYVEITFKDRGTGIPPEHLPRIFEPFFTTKQEGSGLGLAIAYSVVRSHAGAIAVESEPGKGTTVYVYLPASEVSAAPAKKETTTESPRATICGKVLIMDDEDTVLRTVSRLLAFLGYEADTARNGEEAVQKFADAIRNNKPYLFVVLDLTVSSGMGGLETLQRMREMQPDVRALVASGYSSDPVLANYGSYGFAGFLRKPFRLQDLKDALHKIFPEGPA
ncbi:MAG: PAS domain S-box protein [bacterium JZ-2024 1]